MRNDVWVLGATGRVGSAVAARLSQAGVRLVLVGRDRGRLERLAAELGGDPQLLVAPLTDTLAALAGLTDEAPAVVVNTVGPFTTTAAEVAHACPPGTHYVDVANELSAVEQILALDADARARDQVLVTGAGFGVLATEAALLHVLATRPRPQQVRVDAIASVATEPGRLGTALAATVVEVLTSAGAEVRDGRLVRARTAAHPRRLSTPDGEVVSTASGPSGELVAAWRASEADEVVAASTLAPTSPLVRAALPAIAAVVRLWLVSRLATAAIARIRLTERPRPRPSSWAHAWARWSDGTVREGWLRAGDGMDFTVAVTAEVAQRLLRGEGRTGAHTPGALFGPGLAESAGGELVPVASAAAG